MNRTLECSFLIVLVFVGFTGAHNVSGIILSKNIGDGVSLEGKHYGFRCILPPFPENGKWTIINGEGGPGDKIHKDTFLKFQCHPGYDLTPEYPYVFCDTNWKPDIMPKCLKSTSIHKVFGINSSLLSEATKRLKRQNDGFKCTLPPFPKNGKWTVINGNGKPGDEMDTNTVLKFQCDPKYILTPKLQYHLCGTSKNMPICLKRCVPIYSTSTTTVNCKDSTGTTVSCSEATDGTYLTYQCIPFYEALGLKRSIYCSRGLWNFPTPVCEPKCGQKVMPSVIGGEDRNKFEYPWVIAIYIKIEGKFINKCSGTLINPRTVLTAAHCVTIYTNGYALPEDDVAIGAGKYFSQYGDTRDIHAQYLKVARIIIHERYKGDAQRFHDDIALIVTKRQLIMGPVVQPVCYGNIDIINPEVGTVGELAGWGITEDGKLSDTLSTLSVPYKDQITCTQELPIEWSGRYNSGGEICTGFYKQNNSVCLGNTGSGLVFRNPADNRFYIHGVASIFPKILNSSCNNQDIALFTKVARYYEWLDKTSITNNVEDCLLPPFPENGKWELENDTDKLPGDFVYSSSILIYSCRKGYKLSTVNSNFFCVPKFVPPSCDALCPPLYSTPTTNLKCEDVTGNAINCSEAYEGTSLTFQCKIPYYEVLGRKRILHCSGGKWDFPEPVCQPPCGKKVDIAAMPLAFGGQDTNIFEFPWITAIYIKQKDTLINNCGGTLINPSIVLTAAHCVTNTYGDTISEESVEIGAGKYFNEYEDSRDKHAQYSKVARIIVHDEFRGEARRFQYDIALVITKRPLTLGPVVQPACYSNIPRIYPHVGSVGELAGWGVTEDGKPSDTLRTLRIPYKDKTTCTQELPDQWSDRYHFDDKMCAGFYKQNRSVCRGDSGSGLVFRNPEDKRFYVHGIVSISPRSTDGFCNIHDNVLFTKVAHYYEWLDEKSRVGMAFNATS